jgi:hypothetical protein
MQFGVLYGEVRTTEVRELTTCPIGGDRRWVASLTPEARENLIEWIRNQERHSGLRMITAAMEHGTFMEVKHIADVKSWAEKSPNGDLYSVIYLWNGPIARWELLSMRFMHGPAPLDDGSAVRLIVSPPPLEEDEVGTLMKLMREAHQRIDSLSPCEEEENDGELLSQIMGRLNEFLEQPEFVKAQQKVLEARKT